MQQQPPQRGAPPTQGFVGAGMPPPQGDGGLASAEAARARAAEQMALEDAWKALNPDFRTPFASVEDAVSRLLPYHVFADYEEDDGVIDATVGGGGGSVATAIENSSAQKWEDDMGAEVDGFLEHFEKQVLTFNVMNRERAAGFHRAEEQLILEKALYDDERRQMDRVRAALVQHQQQLEHQREQQEAALRARMAALAQAQASGAWPAVQPAAASWQALAAAARGEGGSRGQAQAPALTMMQQQQQPSETMMTAGAWQALAAAASHGEGGSSGQALIQAVMMQHVQRQRQQEEMMAAASRGEGGVPGVQALPPATVMQLMQHQQQQRQQEEMMAVAASRGEMGPGEQALASATVIRQLQLMQQQQQQQEMMAAAAGWQLGGRQMTYAAARGDGSSSSQVLQQSGQGQVSSGAASRMALPWHGSAEGREQ
nr:chromatin modification-related protein EAF1-like [Setaria viridis]